MSLSETRLWNANYRRVWFANLLMYFAFYLIGPLLPLYLRDTFGADKASTGVVLCGFTVTALVIRFFCGYLVDRYSRKKVLLLCYGAFASLFAGYFLASSLFLFALVRTLHGVPFGATTVSIGTMAVDVLPPERRAEGIGYFGLSLNIAMAVGPSLGLYLLEVIGNYNVLFAISLVLALAGFLINSTLESDASVPAVEKKKVTLESFILLKAWPLAASIVGISLAFGVLTTYAAIYSDERLEMPSGSGLFFALLSAGLILSRLLASPQLKKGHIVRNASLGVAISCVGYLVFCLLVGKTGYYASAFIIGFGQGHYYPAFQTMMINLAGDDRRGTATSTMLISWDIGMGLGTILGGVVTEYFGGYVNAFLMSLAVILLSSVWFFLFGRKAFQLGRLR